MIDLLVNDVNYEIENKVILDNVHFEFERGLFYSILGPNGSGKSTLVKAIADDIKIASGEVIVMSKLRTKINHKDFAKNVSILRQFNEISENIKVSEILEYGRMINKSIFSKLDEADQKIVDEMIELTDINDLVHRDFDSLSGGEKQRVLLAMLLITKSKIIILDEPTNHLDIKFQIELLKIIREINLKEKITVVCILHDINLASVFSDYIYLLKDGKVKYSGKVNEIITEEIISDVFEVKCNVIEGKQNRHIEFITYE